MYIEQEKLSEYVGVQDQIMAANGGFQEISLNKNEPWKKMKENKDEAGEILGQSIIIINTLSSILEPFLPESSKKLQNILFDKEINEWKIILPESGKPFKKPVPLFEKLDEEIVLMENRNSLNE